MTELINKEELLRRFADFGREIPKEQVMAVLARIDEGIVRCKDCKYWNDWGLGAGTCERSKNGCFWYGTDFNDYCSFGERSEE